MRDAAAESITLGVKYMGAKKSLPEIKMGSFRSRKADGINCKKLGRICLTALRHEWICEFLSSLFLYQPMRESYKYGCYMDFKKQ